MLSKIMLHCLCSLELLSIPMAAGLQTSLPLTIAVILLVTPRISETLNNGLANTPPMGWLAWERFRCNTDCDNDPHHCIHERLYREMADRLVADGYSAVGYKYITLDDCWMASDRHPQTHDLRADPRRFPSGLRDLVTYVHSKGLKMGGYQSFGERTCMGYPGSKNNLQRDADFFARNEFDYIKFDACFTPASELSNGYRKFGTFLNHTGRRMIYSCSWPYYEHFVGIVPNLTEVARYCNIWRVYHDIDESYYSVLNIVDYYVKYQGMLQPAAGPGQWNDPDMLIIGNFGLSYEQSKAQMAIWAILAAPLVMSNDLRNIQTPFRKILLNKKVISVNQDILGVQGKKMIEMNGIEIWFRPIFPKGSYAVVFFNRRIDGAVPRKLNVSLSQLGLNHPHGYMVEDLFDDMSENLLVSEDYLQGTVNPSGVLMYTFKVSTAVLSFVTDDMERDMSRIADEKEDFSTYSERYLTPTLIFFYSVTVGTCFVLFLIMDCNVDNSISPKKETA